MEFKKITLKDLDVIKPFFIYDKSRICDFTVGGIFMWKDYFSTEFAIENGCLFLRQYFNGELYYFLPLSDDINSAFSFLINSVKDKEINFCVFPSNYIYLLKENNLNYTLKEERGFFDYLYNASDLASFSGKKYSPQRNLIHQFKRAYPDYEFIEINSKNAFILKEFLNNNFFIDRNASPFKKEEEKKVFEVLDNFNVYNFFGSYLTADNTVFGFSLGEIIGDTAYIHIEKASKNVKGAYQTLVNSFADKYCKSVSYINREEDMNDAGLRQSKLSYNPSALLPKYTVYIKR